MLIIKPGATPRPSLFEVASLAVTSVGMTLRIVTTRRTKIRKHLFDDEWDFLESERSRYVFHGLFSSSSSGSNDNVFDEIEVISIIETLM